VNDKIIKNYYFLGVGMNNIINVAKKEFADLMGSWLVVFVFAAYLVLTAYTAYQFSVVLSNHLYIEGDLVKNFLCGVSIVLSNYGSLLAVVIGFASISSERQGNALNTLLVKPLYRDTIINGKLLGSLTFLLCMYGFAVILYTSGLFIVCSNLFISMLPEYMAGLPFVIGVSLAYTMIFFSISMLLSILFKNSAFALSLGVISIFISETFSLIDVMQGLSILFGDDVNTIAGWLPDNVFGEIIFMLYRSHPGMTVELSTIWLDVIKLLLIMVAVVVISYTVFLRKDVS
jgi:ABC-2 type transport system permease protein